MLCRARPGTGVLSLPSSLVPASLRELELQLQLPNTVRNVRNNQPEVGTL